MSCQIGCKLNVKVLPGLPVDSGNYSVLSLTTKLISISYSSFWLVPIAYLFYIVLILTCSLIYAIKWWWLWSSALQLTCHWAVLLVVSDHNSRTRVRLFIVRLLFTQSYTQPSTRLQGDNIRIRQVDTEDRRTERYATHVINPRPSAYRIGRTNCDHRS